MASNFRDTYTQASFGGCEFEFISTNDRRGNRLSLHEYPQRDTPFAEGMGRSARVFRITGAVRGDDHVARSAEIIEKCECGDTQTLVHPLYGQYEVKCASVSVDNDYLRARETLLSFEFYEAGEFIYPRLLSTSVSTVSGTVPSFTQSVFIGFNLGQSDAGLTLFTRALGQLIRLLYARHISWGGESVLIDNDLLNLTNTPDQFTQDDFSDVIRRAIEGLYLYAKTPQDALTALFEIMQTKAPLGSTECDYALQTRLMATGYAAQAALNNGFETPSQALGQMSCLIDNLEGDQELISAKCLDGLFGQTLDLIATISADFRRAALGLPPVITRALCGRLPSLVAAYETFGNLDTFDAFEKLNARKESMFYPSSVFYQAQ